jgi:hypothetical protein
MGNALDVRCLRDGGVTRALRPPLDRDVLAEVVAEYFRPQVRLVLHGLDRDLTKAGSRAPRSDRAGILRASSVRVARLVRYPILRERGNNAE